MNIYFSEFQKDVLHPDWSKVVGLSNYDINVRETYIFHKLHLTGNKINMCETDPKSVIRFYRKRHSNNVNFETDIPLRTLEILLSSIENIIFPKSLNAYVTLEKLEITHCKLEGFPWRGIPGSLKSLNLSYNYLGGNINLSHTNGLRFIDLSYNRIENVHLPYDCNTANISNNKCTDIIFYNPMMHCDFSWNRLREFSACKWLETCNIAHNLLEKCNVQLSKKMIQLNASFNSLNGTLDVKDLKQLEKLNVSFNGLSWIDGLESCPCLQTLDVSNNCMETAIVPKVSRVSLQCNPLQFFEWHQPSNDSGFSLAGLINGDKQGNPMLNMASQYIQRVLKMNEIDKIYGECKGATGLVSVNVDLSKTNIQEFPDIMELQSNVIVHLYFYDNEYVDIPFHPRLHVHVGRKQIYNWRQTCDESTRLRITQLENQKFFIVDNS